MPYTVAQEIAKYQPYQLKTNNRISRNDDSYTSNIKNGSYKYFSEKDFIDISSASRTRLNWKNSNQECEPAIRINNYKSIQIKVKDEIFQLPNELSEIASEIKRSKNILNLEYDWDSEGGLSVPQFVWERASRALIIYSKWIWENKGVILLTPSIDALADGSIDIMWNGTKGRLLLNIKNSLSSEAHYYGDTYGGKDKFKGAIDLNEVKEFFAYWLIEFLK
jgi:hypothetical protein